VDVAEERIKKIRKSNDIEEEDKITAIEAIRKRIKRPDVNMAVLKSLISRRMKEEGLIVTNDHHLVSLLVPLFKPPRNRVVPQIIQELFLHPHLVIDQNTKVFSQIEEYMEELKTSNGPLYKLIIENPELKKSTTTYEHAARNSLEDDLIYVMQRAIVRITVSEMILCRPKYESPVLDTKTEMWKIAAEALLTLGATWAIQEHDVKLLRGDWYEKVTTKDKRDVVRRKDAFATKRPREID